MPHYTRLFAELCCKRSTAAYERWWHMGLHLAQLQRYSDLPVHGTSLDVIVIADVACECNVV